MNTLELDKNILKIIRYGAVVPIIIFSFIITYILIDHKNYELKEQIQLIKNKYLTDNKKAVKDEIKRVVNSIKFEIENSENELKHLLKEKVYEAHSIASNIYLDESVHSINGHDHSKEHIFRTIKYALGGMIYNKGRGYIFLDDSKGIKLLQPLNKRFEGKNLFEYEDAKGYKFVKKIVETIKNKTETYDKYYWYKSKSDTTAYEKMSFYKYFEPYNIAIGTGEYLVDFENELKEKLLKRINNIRFGNSGYIFIFDKKGTYLSHFKKEKIGTNGFKVKDAKGNFFIKEFFDFAVKNKEGFFSYIASSKPNGQAENRKKISFVLHFKKWNWVLGAGFYMQELDSSIKKREIELQETYESTINSIMYLSLITTILLLLISFYASEIIANKFKKYKEVIKNEAQKTIEKDKLLVQQSKLATMGEMIGNISHQWRQPLSVISTASTGTKLQKELNVLDDKELIRSMDLINNSAQYLSQTIEDFRNFFNPNKSKEKFTTISIFNKTSTLICSRFKDYEIEIIKDIEDLEITESESELLQVLVNILKNARDELVKKNKGEKRLLFIATSKNSNNLIITIKDNAGGIPIEVMNKVFEPYFTTKSSSDGTGIGLYMSKQIIEKMNGKISVNNVTYKYEGIEYKGASFKIMLPL